MTEYDMMGHGAPAASSGKQIKTDKAAGIGKSMSSRNNMGKGKKTTSIGKSKGMSSGGHMAKVRC